jgi:hypothetical protein
MSTEFRTTDTDEFAMLRWSSRRVGGAAFDFGTRARREAVERHLVDGGTLTGEIGEVFGLAEFLVDVTDDRCTFGEFGGTVALGSGEAFDRMTETDQ